MAMGNSWVNSVDKNGGWGQDPGDGTTPIVPPPYMTDGGPSDFGPLDPYPLLLDDNGGGLLGGGSLGNGSGINSSSFNIPCEGYNILPNFVADYFDWKNLTNKTEVESKLQNIANSFNGNLNIRYYFIGYTATDWENRTDNQPKTSNELAEARAKTLAERTIQLVSPDLRAKITIGAKTDDRNINYFGYKDAGIPNIKVKTVIIYIERP